MSYIHIDCGNVVISTDLEVLESRHQEFDVILARNMRDPRTDEFTPEWWGFKGVDKEDTFVQMMIKDGCHLFEN